MRQTPSLSVFDTSLVFSAVKSNASARMAESAALESMNCSVHGFLRDTRSSKMKEVVDENIVAAAILPGQ